MNIRICAALVTSLALAACANQAQQPTTAQSQPAPSSNLGLRAANVDYVSGAQGAQAGLPPTARPGECYARVVSPARTETVAERVLRKPASERVDTVAAQYRDVEERVLVKPATTRLEVVPARYEEVEERVMVRPASTRLEPVAATYKTVSERVLVKPAQSVWKRSSELTPEERRRQGIDPNAGDIMCLVVEPAEYRTVSKEVVDRPASTRSVPVAAEYAMVKKTVQRAPATTRQITEPAEYRTVTVKKMVTPERVVRTPIAAEYDTVSREVVRSPATAEWRQILCDTNATTANIVTIQNSLRTAGFNPGRNDGIADDRTLDAVRQFQRARNLPVDNDRYINIRTARALGVRA